jgi:hypothetical protein
MSPLAMAMYQVLRMRLPKPIARKALIDHAELISELYRYPDAPQDLDPRDPRIDQAAVELAEWCRAAKLPLISALVIHGDTRLPADTYFAAAHPGLADEPRREAWENELKEVIMTFYPAKM